MEKYQTEQKIKAWKILKITADHTRLEISYTDAQLPSSQQKIGVEIFVF